MSEEGEIVVKVSEWEKQKRRHGKLLKRYAVISNRLERLQEQVDADNNQFAAAFLLERRERQRAEAAAAEVMIINKELKAQLRAARKRNIKRKVDFTEK